MKWISTILSCIIATLSMGQQYNFKRFSVEEGLAEPGVYCMTEGPEGRLWLGLENGGVEIFNGWSIEAVDKQLTGSNVRSIFKANNGEMWIGSAEDGITILGQDTTNLDLVDGLFSRHIRAFAEDAQNNVWVGTIGGGISIFKDKKLTKSIKLGSGLYSVNAPCLLFSINQEMWVGTDRGISVFRDGKLNRRYLRKDGLAGNKIQCLAEDKQGNIWVGTDRGLSKIEDGEITSFHSGQGIRGKKINSLLVTSRNELWVGTRFGVGKYIIDPSSDKVKFKWYSADNGLSDNRIRYIYEDQSKAIWLATNFGGICKFFNESFCLIRRQEGLSANAVNVVYVNPFDKSIWIGTHGGGIDWWKGRQSDEEQLSFRILDVDHGLNGDDIFSFSAVSNQDVFVGTDGGLAWLHDFHVKKIWDEYDGFFDGNHVIKVVSNANNVLVLTNRHELVAFERNEQTFEFSALLTKELGQMTEGEVFALERAGDDFFVATSEELYRFRIHTHSIVEPSNYPLKNIEGIGGSKDQKLAFNTRNELFLLKDDGEYTVVDSLDNDGTIKFLIQEKRDKYWLGISKGIAEIQMSGRKIVSLKKYTFDEGFLGVQAFKDAAAFVPGGNLYVGSVKGLMEIKPDGYFDVEQEVKVSFAGILSEGDELDVDQFCDHLEGAVPVDLVLPYDKDNLTFRLNTYHLKNPKEVEIKYQLEGWDKQAKVKKIGESIDDKGVFHVDYDHISHGSYKFKAFAKTPDGEWSKKPLVIDLEITPKWWQNPKYYLPLGLLIAALVVFAVYYRTRLLIKQKEKLEKLVSARTEDLKIEKQKSENLLLNILPAEIASELKSKGSAKTKKYEQASVLFTDFKGFTQLSLEMSPVDLVAKLDEIFVQFDEVIERNKLEKIKTIGDAYMCASGIPEENPNQVKNIIIAGLQLVEVMRKFNAQQAKENKPTWDVRVGIHTGELIAGVVGKKKFAYDIWGDTVNIASRMESNSEPGRVNISKDSYEAVRDFFEFETRGKIEAKNRGELEMYFVKRIKKEYSADERGTMPKASIYQSRKLV